jgi:mannose-6-phosphate isomerase-like protein (cupin superfamily)
VKLSLVIALPLLAATVGCVNGAPPPNAPSTLTAAPVDVRPFQTNILAEAAKNESYRRVLFTGERSQLVVMSIPPGGDIGVETHAHVEQLLFIASGQGKAIVNGVETPLTVGDVVVATPRARHDIVNTGSAPLQIYTVYAPPNHLDGRVQATKKDADADRADNAFGAAVR